MTKFCSTYFNYFKRPENCIKIMSLNNRRRISSSSLILIGIAIPVITLFVVFIQTYESILSNQEQTQSVIKSHETINSLKNVLISMINAETGQRGYIITGNLSYLEPYKSAVSNLDNQLVTLNTLISGNSGQESKLGQLISLIDERLSILNSTIQTRYMMDTLRQLRQ
jgi:CHASE3 domain sensor protein